MSNDVFFIHTCHVYCWLDPPPPPALRRRPSPARCGGARRANAWSPTSMARLWHGVEAPDIVASLGPAKRWGCCCDRYWDVTIGCWTSENLCA